MEDSHTKREGQNDPTLFAVRSLHFAGGGCSAVLSGRFSPFSASLPEVPARWQKFARDLAVEQARR